MKKYSITFVLAILFSVIYSCKEKVTENTKEQISTSKEIKNTLSFIKTDGTKLVDTLGNEIVLKGTNIGNWLVPEGYMFKMEQVNAPRKIDELLHELFQYPHVLFAVTNKMKNIPTNTLTLCYFLLR